MGETNWWQLKLEIKILINATNAIVTLIITILQIMTVQENCFWRLILLANFRKSVEDPKIFWYVHAAISCMSKGQTIQIILVKAAIIIESTILNILNAKPATLIYVSIVVINLEILNKEKMKEISFLHWHICLKIFHYLKLEHQLSFCLRNQKILDSIGQILWVIENQKIKIKIIFFLSN